MFYLYNITVTNICQHKSLSFRLTPGLTCVIGDNGKGKSNLMETVFLLLVGDAHGEVTDMLKWKTTRGSVVGSIKTEDGELTLSRDLKLQKSGLVVVKHTLVASWLPEKLERKADIDAFLKKYAGESLVYMDMLSFARQNQFELMLKAKHADRVSILQSLLGLRHLEKLRDLLLSVKGRIEIPADKTGVIAEYEERIRQNIEPRDSAIDRKAKLDEMLIASKDEYTRQSGIMLQPFKDDIDKQLIDLRLSLEENKQELAEVYEVLGTLLKTEDMPKLDSKGWAYHLNWRRAQEAVDVQKRRLSAAETEFAGLKIELTPEQLKLKLVQLETEYSDNLLERDKCVERLRLIELGQCPTCGSDLQVSPDDKKAISGQRDKHAIRLSKLADSIKAQKTTIEKHRVASLEIIRETRELSDKLAKLEAVKQYADFDSISFETASAWHGQYNDQDGLRNELTDRRTVLEDKRNKISDEIQKLERTTGASKAARDAAGTFCIIYDSARRQHKDQERIITATSEAIRLNEEYLLLAGKEQEQRNKALTAVALLDKSRDALHANAVPLLVARGTTARLNALIQKYLDLFEFPHRVFMNEDLDFMVDFPDMTASAALLSGGQTMVVAMSVRFAMQELFTFGCGILILDEPTNNLDANNRELLQDMLQKAGDYFKAKHLTVLVPTHDQDIEAIAENKIVI